MKHLSVWLALAMVVSLLAGCSGTTVVYTNCTCPPASHESVPTTPSSDPAPKPTTPSVISGGLKTGLFVTVDVSESVSASDDADGQAKYDVTAVAVTVDDAGVIHDCAIDSVPATVKFDGDGVLLTDRDAVILSKNEMGEDYGMVAYGGAVAEWDVQVAALAAFAQGKTVEQLKTMAVDETGYAKDVDLATTATIYLSGYVSAIENAVANARHLGAQVGDTLKFANRAGVTSCTSADGETNGLSQLDVTLCVLTLDGDEKITSCVFDSLQGKVNFDSQGQITTDLTVPVRTKNQLGFDYGMVAWGGATYEWFEQAENLAAYLVGKTPQEVMGIAVTDNDLPQDADLATSVTISISGFLTMVEKTAASGE